jgi:hypothetical protein
MSQESILENAKKYIFMDDLKEFKNLFTSSIELPNANTVSEILKYAASHHREDMVKEICQLKGSNKPHQDAVDYALAKFFRVPSQLENFKFICEQSTVKPSREKIEEFLKSAASSSEGEYIEFICSLNTENKPQQPAIDDAFKTLSRNNGELLKKFCSNNSITKPSVTAIDYALGQLHSRNALEPFKYICEQSPVKPSQKRLEEILKESHACPHYKWDFVEYIYFLDSKNLSNTTINDVFKEAAYHKKWALVHRINAESATNPEVNAVNYALNQAYSQENLQEFQHICTQSVIKPSQNQIEEILEKAHSFSKPKWNFVDYICSLSSENKPPQAAINAALKALSWCKEQSALIKKLCTNNSINKPSISAIDYVLERIFSNDDMDLFKYICEQGIIKPSQNQIEKILEKAHSFSKPKWNFVDYICSFSSENKPRQPAIDDALKTLSWCKDQLGLIKKLCSKDSVNKPSGAAIDYVLEKIFSNDDMDTFQYICEQSVIKPSQNQIEKILKAAHNWPYKWNFVDYICSLSSENKPPQSAIDAALKALSLHKDQSALIKKLCSKDSVNKPSGAAIDYVLEKNFSNDDMDTFQYICEQSVIKPSQNQIEKILKAAHNWPYKWNFVEYLCLLNSENKPGQNAFDDAFHTAAEVRQWKLVKTLYLSANKPTLLTIESVLKIAACSKQLEIIQDFCKFPVELCPGASAVGEAFIAAAEAGNVDIVRFFFEQVHDKLIPQNVTDAFLRATGENALLVIRYFCQLGPENRPDQQLIGQALGAAASKGHLDLIEFFLGADNPVKPTPEAAAEAFVKVAAEDFLSIVSYFCMLETEHKPDQKLIGEALGAAASKGHLDIIKFFLGPDNPLKPTPEAVAEAFVKGALGNRVDIIDYFCMLETEHKPNQKLIGQALIAAASKGSSYVVLFFMATDNAIKPTSEDIAEAFVKASAAGMTKVVAYFLSPDKELEFKFTQEIMDKALYEAVKTPSYELSLIQYLVKSNEASKLLSKQGLQNALNEAKTKPHNKDIVEIINLLTQEINKGSSHQSSKTAPGKGEGKGKASSHKFYKTAKKSKKSPPTKGQSNKPAPEAIANTLYSAVAREDLPEIKQLCTQLNYNKPTANVLRKALKMTLDPEIKECLLDAQKILKLHLQIEALVAYGEELKKENSSMGDGAVNIAQGIKTIADDYTSAYFGNQIEVKAACREQLSSALSTAFKKMGTHRAKWKIHLANVALAATGVGLLINYLVSGHVFFSNTGRQNKVQAIVDKLDNLTPTNNSKP